MSRVDLRPFCMDREKAEQIMLGRPGSVAALVEVVRDGEWAVVRLRIVGQRLDLCGAGWTASVCGMRPAAPDGEAVRS